MKKRRILLALIMLVICGISLTTATYAWFTANTRVTVEEIDVKATASGGIQISADASTWSNAVGVDDLKAITGTNYIPDSAANKKLSPVTTVGVNGGNSNFDFYYGTLSDDGSHVTLTKAQDSDGYYVAFDLYFYSARDYTLKFGTTTTVDVSGATDAGLKKSMRVGFLVQGTDATSTTDTALALTGGTEQIIWEPNADKRSDYNRLNGIGNDGEVQTYMGGKAEATTAVELTDSTKFETVTNATHGLITSNVDAYPTGQLFDFNAGITKVRTYIWIEGQDIDNEDQVSLGTGVKVVLDFVATIASA